MSKERVVVAMSGGVDSSVAAAFLKDKGYEVIGLTMQLRSGGSRCCSEQDIHDARRVAGILNIPHYVVSLQEPFQKAVIDYFISEYEKGRTPNPCAVCNPKIKFGLLLEKALALGAAYFATGHYAVISFDQNTQRVVLKRGKERGKDQSYFLARLSQKALSYSLFPVGNFSKSKIRKLADRFNLPVAQKTESQEVCFVPEDGVTAFIKAERNKSYPSGPILNVQHELLGTHEGIIGFTIGQRKRLGVALGKPMYVNKIDAETNAVFIGDETHLYKKRFLAKDTNWISVPKPEEQMQLGTRIRYKHRPALSRIKWNQNGSLEVKFDRPQRAITPGQLSVFYHNDIVVGSAWIDKVLE